MQSIDSTKTRGRRRLGEVTLLSAALAAAWPGTGVAASAEELEQRVDQLEQELDVVRKEARAEERAATRWHLAGYASAGYTDSDIDNDSFNAGTFNPGFHFQYRDLVLFESEFEFSTTEDGETETELEYSQLDVFLHDSVTLVVGKFLSPIGQFQERLHPAWINKLPTRPAGFGHGGAQPLNEIGVQLRGGVPVGNQTVTYAVYTGNGPRIGHHGPELEGFGSDDNDDKAFGGRFAWFPMPQLELGVSFLEADELEPEDAGSGPAPTTPGYSLQGVDAAYTQGPWDVRFEYLDSELDAFTGAAEEAASTNEGIAKTEWEAFYVQVAYQFGKWEPVIRYGEFEIDGFDEFAEDAEDRTSVGINYLFGPSFIGKAAFEDRDFADPAAEDDERFVLQLAYGF